MGRVELLLAQMDEVYGRLAARLESLTDAEDFKVIYHEWAFGPRRLTFPDLAGLGDDQLDGPRWTNWGERWPAWRVLWTMIDHDAHHGGEIGCLRDLYRVTAGGA
jgi:hypothetical protein